MLNEPSEPQSRKAEGIIRNTPCVIKKTLIVIRGSSSGLRKQLFLSTVVLVL